MNHATSGKHELLKAMILTVFIGASVCLVLPVLGIGYFTLQPRIRNYFHRLPFKSTGWRDEKLVYSDDPIRKYMLPSLLRTHTLVGRSTDEILALLGPSMERAEYLYYAERLERLPADSLVYWIAPQEGFMAFDSNWLVVSRDSHGQINNYRIMHAGVPQVRNPDCERFEAFRIDESSRRLFTSEVLLDAAALVTAAPRIHEIRAFVAKCRAAWGQDWHASFFSDSKFAGYKDEPGLAESVRDGSWARAYVAEYDNSTAQLILYPALPGQKQVFSVNRGRQ